MTTLDYTPLNREVKFQERMRHKDAWQFISAVCIALLFVVVAVSMLFMEAHALAIALVVRSPADIFFFRDRNIAATPS